MLEYSKETREKIRKNSGIIVPSAIFILSYDKGKNVAKDADNIAIKKELSLRIINGLIKSDIISYPAESTVLFICEERIQEVYQHLFNVDGIDGNKFIVCEVTNILPNQNKSQETIDYIEGLK